MNFAISQRDRAAGVDHIGIQTDTAEELAVVLVTEGSVTQAASDKAATATPAISR